MNNFNNSKILIYRNYILLKLCHLKLFAIFNDAFIYIYIYPLMQYRIYIIYNNNIRSI